MGEYTSAIALAQRLIAKKGGPVTLRTFTPGADSGQEWKPAESVPVDQPNVRAVFLPQNLQTQRPQQYADGTQVHVGDMQVYVAAADLAEPPSLGSEVIRADGEVWTVKACEPLAPGDVTEVIIYTLWVTQ